MSTNIKTKEEVKIWEYRVYTLKWAFDEAHRIERMTSNDTPAVLLALVKLQLAAAQNDLSWAESMLEAARQKIRP